MDDLFIPEGTMMDDEEMILPQSLWTSDFMEINLQEHEENFIYRSQDSSKIVPLLEILIQYGWQLMKATCLELLTWSVGSWTGLKTMFFLKVASACYLEKGLCESHPFTGLPEYVNLFPGPYKPFLPSGNGSLNWEEIGTEHTHMRYRDRE